MERGNDDTLNKCYWVKFTWNSKNCTLKLSPDKFLSKCERANNKVSKSNLREYFYDFGFDKGFLNMIQKVLMKKERLLSWTSIYQNTLLRVWTGKSLDGRYLQTSDMTLMSYLSY